jgi:hypothetical protein
MAAHIYLGGLEYADGEYDMCERFQVNRTNLEWPRYTLSAIRSALYSARDTDLENT